MVEDQLFRDERIRLEALAQANLVMTMTRPSAEDIIAVAEKFEDYIRGPEGKSNAAE